MPTRGQLLAEAQAMFAKTTSLDDIVDRAYELLVEAVRFFLVVPPLVAVANPDLERKRGILPGHPDIR
jgi:stearoyl-CoA desaturase (delta-9 desaturase)